MNEKDKIFLFKWFSSLFAVWYVSIGLYLYDPYILQIIYWPLHTHDVEIKVIENTENKNDEKSTNINENILIEDVGKFTGETSSIIKNANYVGTDNRGTFFKLNANLAQVFHDKPNLSNMEIVNAVITLRDGKIIYIKSDYAIYDKLTNNTNFMGNILVTESNNQITCDNLDLIMSENLIKIYNNVTYNGEKGLIKSDEVHIDIFKADNGMWYIDLAASITASAREAIRAAAFKIREIEV